MTHPYLLAHDLGTTGNTATLFDAEEGVALASTFEAHPTYYPQPAWAEQDPADYERAIWQATRRLRYQTGIEPAGIAAVSYSSTVQGALLVDRQGTPLGRAITSIMPPCLTFSDKRMRRSIPSLPSYRDWRLFL